VPNPNAQADLVRDALNQAKIDPRTLSYIETHGTGTALGDPIEITGLMMAFEGAAETKQFCPIGSVKSNIGHLESAAGIASVTKALLQFKHEQLVPSLHVDPLNPNINFGDTPFYVQTRLTEWKRSTAHPRRIGVSSFGAGGSNAHLILEEYIYAQEPKSSSLPVPPEAFVLSARDPDALCRYAEKVEDFLAGVSDLPLADIAYTSQVGRTPMNARLVILASSVKDLRGKLNQWINLQKSNDIEARGGRSELENVFYGNIKESNQSAHNLIEGSAGMAFLNDLLAKRDLEKIARLWIMGVEINWSLMPRSTKPGRVSLPTYPFAKERCWVNQETPLPRVMQKSTADARKVPGQGRAVEKRRTQLVKLGIDESAPAEVVGSTTLLAKTEAYLKEMIGEEIKLSTDRIGSSDRFESFGIDSVMIARFNASLERDLGALPKTLFYEYETVAELAKFLLQVAQEPLVALFGPADWSATPQSTEIEEEAPQAMAPEPDEQEEAEELDNGAAPEPIAIIGIHGYYPRSANLDEFWENLKQGRDLIDVVPPKRWDYQEFYDPDPTAASEGKIYCKWGGFLDDYDKFDPHFFNIPPEEAKIIDPQERLFLESVWAAIEDAGYTRESLKKRFPKERSADV
ncbi:MAG: hypothetical protein J2P31_14690, partial [Blastocatellia bacterium]|nr:hypothetical protein [Blastocatellia bacterium]